MGFTETGPIGRDELQSAFMMNYSPQSLVVRAPRCGAAAGVAGDRKPGGPGLGSSPARRLCRRQRRRPAPSGLVHAVTPAASGHPWPRRPACAVTEVGCQWPSAAPAPGHGASSVATGLGISTQKWAPGKLESGNPGMGRPESSIDEHTIAVASTSH